MITLKIDKMFNQPSLDRALPFESGREPILQPESGDVPEIRRIVCYECKIINERRGADHQIHLRNGHPLLEQLAFDLAELPRAGLVEIQHGDLEQKVGDQRENAVGVRTFVGAGVKFRQDDGGDRQSPGMLEESMRKTSRASHVT